MARRKPEYPDTSWGREAEWEDIEKKAEPRRKEREPEEFRQTYAKAKQMMADGKTPEEITAALDVPAKPEFMTSSGTVPQWAKAERAVEESMVYVRRSAIADALAGRPPKF
jgi:hypothetical protein